MQVIIPKTITPDILTSNVAFPAAGETEWVAGSYDTGDTVYVGTTLYRSLKDANTDEPTVGELATPATWLAVGSVMRYKMFDAENQTQTENADEIEVTFDFIGLKTGLAIFNVDANEVTVNMDSARGGAGVYNETYSAVDRSGVVDWWTYYKHIRPRQSSFSFDDLPAYTDGVVTVTIDNTGGTAKCGNLVIGELFDLGKTLTDMEPVVRDISRYTTDAFRRRTYISKGSVRELNATVMFDTAKHDQIQRVMEQLVGTPTAWIGARKFSTSIIWGRGSYRPTLTTSEKSDARYEIEGEV